MSAPVGVLINGSARGPLSAADRGLLYGDGLFETIAVSDGIPRLWQRHMDRLRAGCYRLGIAVPDPTTLWREALALGEGSHRSVLRLTVTRGHGGRGYRPPEACEPSRILALHPWPDHPRSYHTDGVAVRVCRTRLGLNPALAGLKHLNRLEQVLARGEWGQTFQEGLMLDASDRVVEATASNLLVLRHGALLTPLLDQAGVAGVMRGWLLERARAAGWRVTEAHLTLDEVRDAEGLALSNAVIGVWPVGSLEGRERAVGPALQQLVAWGEEAREAP